MGYLESAQYSYRLGQMGRQVFEQSVGRDAASASTDYLDFVFKAEPGSSKIQEGGKDLS